MSKADRPDHPGAADRFNEDQATYAVRGDGAPDLEAGVAAIREVLKTLPSRPGVYRMQDARGDVLYVGKARALKNRVTNYTQVARLPKRLQRMVSQTRSMTIVTTRTEAEALLLEAQLIKRFRPPTTCCCATTKASRSSCFARTMSSRGSRSIAAPGGSKGQYYGPFASAGSVTRTLNALQKLFLLRSCSDSFFANRIAAVPALPDQALLGALRRADRRARIMASWSRRRRSSSPASRPGFRRGCRGSMAEAAERQDYELAAVYRDRLRALTYIQGSQTVHAEGLGDADVFALACKGGTRVDPGLLHSRRAELGASRLLPGAYQRCSRSRGFVELSGAILRGHAAAEADSRRSRAGRPRVARGGAVRARRAQGRDRATRSAARAAS